MDRLTAFIHGGPATAEGMRLPTHALFLTEGRPWRWTLAGPGLPGAIPRLGEPLAWVPTTEDVLEDGLLMLGLHAGRFPKLCQRADECFRAGWRGGIDLNRELTAAQRHELHTLNQQQAWHWHLAVTVLFGSAVAAQVGRLRHYRFGLDLCPWRVWRNGQSPGSNVLVCGEASPDLEDPAS